MTTNLEATRLLASVYALRRKPVDGLSIEDLRVLIGPTRRTRTTSCER